MKRFEACEARAADHLLNAVSSAHDALDQPHALFGAVDRALAATLGHRLFTILAFDPDTGEAGRIYSNQPGAYPTGERKKLPPSRWAAAVLERGEAFIGFTLEDIRGVFADHALIASLGCQSVLNMPIRWRGRTVGSLNLLHEAQWYERNDVDRCRPFAQLVLPALLTPAVST
jgi:hypothetical protein